MPIRMSFFSFVQKVSFQKCEAQVKVSLPFWVMSASKFIFFFFPAQYALAAKYNCQKFFSCLALEGKKCFQQFCWQKASNSCPTFFQPTFKNRPMTETTKEQVTTGTEPFCVGLERQGSQGISSMKITCHQRYPKKGPACPSQYIHNRPSALFLGQEIMSGFQFRVEWTYVTATLHALVGSTFCSVSPDCFVVQCP